MADPIIGRNTYGYLAGAAIVHLTDWDWAAEQEFAETDPDIGSVRRVSVPLFISEGGTINFNFTSDDFLTIRNAVYNQTAVSLYLYPEKGSSKLYCYGNVYLGNLTHTNPLLSTVKGSVTFRNSDTTGFTWLTTA